jgi:hypothetical protein
MPVTMVVVPVMGLHQAARCRRRLFERPDRRGAGGRRRREKYRRSDKKQTGKDRFCCAHCILHIALDRMLDAISGKTWPFR